MHVYEPLSIVYDTLVPFPFFLFYLHVILCQYNSWVSTVLGEFQFMSQIFFLGEADVLTIATVSLQSGFDLQLFCRMTLWGNINQPVSCNVLAKYNWL